MKALIRQPNEIVFNSDEQTVTELTNEHLYGGMFAVCENTPKDAIASDFDISDTEKEEVIEESYEDMTEEGETVTNTRTYTKIRKLKIATLNEARYNARKAEESKEGMM